ncbi:MAG TPA: SDR family oxidoreductase [Rhodocyclaceae bacterium]|nr:SDR family oxidoreductase [Rhodocyclaceae bacterium]
MIYFVTGATGFIGKRLVARLLERRDSTIYFLTRDASTSKLDPLYAYWKVDKSRAIPVAGDLREPRLGVSKADIRKLKGKVSHFYHLAALYDLKADPQEQVVVNVEGTRNMIAFAEAIEAGCLHHVSSIAAAGLFEGIFREDMFDEAENLEHPYFGTKHESERIVRTACRRPWRIYRPGIVVGDSRTGEMDKIDGPYYFFKLIQRTRRLLPPWMPTIGLEGGRINIVPVDFVVAAMDHLSHLKGHDGKCFHLTDPHPRRVGDVLNIFARAGHAPAMALRVNAALFGFIPRGVKKSLMALTPVRRIRNAVMKDLGLPDDILQFVNYPTRFDCREAEKALAGSGITVPALEDYAWKLWDYWERHLDPDLFIDRSLRGRVAGKVVLITGGSSGIGKAAAFKIAAAGATTIVVARDRTKLDETLIEAKALGQELIAYSADVADEKQCAELFATLTSKHGSVDILVNSAGRSIRRGIETSFDRLHDYERTMSVNYFGALRLTMGLLPGMIAKRRGHVINISSIGVLTNAPRFSAYVASKAALDAFTRCAASEFVDRGIEFTTINMPLVKTPMIAPTRMYEHVPTLTPDEAADLIVDAIIHRPARIATRLGIFGQVVHAVAPRVAQIIMNTAFRMFPDSTAAQGVKEDAPAQPTADQIAFSQMMRGIHF